MNNSNKHTPGPWTINGLDVQGQTMDDIVVANIQDAISNPADARLIAAVPELLEVAQLILAEWEKPTAGVLPGELIARLSQYSDIARAAVRKATGGNE